MFKKNTHHNLRHISKVGGGGSSWGSEGGRWGINSTVLELGCRSESHAPN